MDKKEILDLLETIYEGKQKGISNDDESLKRDGFERTLIKQAISRDLINFSGIDYYLKDKGFNVLNQGRIAKNTEQLKEIMNKISENIKKSTEITNKFSKSSEKHNKEMIEHTKTLKKLTIIILVVTILNSSFFVYQIIQQSPEKPNIQIKEVSRDLISGDILFRECSLNDCVFKEFISLESSIDREKDYVVSYLFILNEGKSTEDLNLIMGCNFDLKGIMRRFALEGFPEVNIKIVQAENYNSAIEIDSISLSDIVVIGLIQTYDDYSKTSNQKCNFVYSSEDIEHEEKEVFFSQPVIRLGFIESIEIK